MSNDLAMHNRSMITRVAGNIESIDEAIEKYFVVCTLWTGKV